MTQHCQVVNQTDSNEAGATEEWEMFTRLYQGLMGRSVKVAVTQKMEKDTRLTNHQSK